MESSHITGSQFTPKHKALEHFSCFICNSIEIRDNKKSIPTENHEKRVQTPLFFSLHFIIFSSHIPVNSIKEEKKEVKNNG